MLKNVDMKSVLLMEPNMIAMLVCMNVKGLWSNANATANPKTPVVDTRSESRCTRGNFVNYIDTK